MRIVRTVVIGLAIAAIGAGGYWYMRHTERYRSTDDAYLSADWVQVAAQVNGPVTDVYIANQQYVHEGAPLFRIDRRPYQLAADQAKARLALARQQVEQDQAAVASAKADVRDHEVLLENAKTKLQRARQLKGRHYVSQQTIDDAEAAYKSAQATLNLTRAKLNEAQKKLGTPGAQNERIQEADAALKQAQWDLDHTVVAATCNGRIAESNLQPGATVRVGVPVFVLICDRDYSVYANYKETELGGIHPGQPVDITVDMYPDRHFKGTVESINGASGVAFSLLPPQNATGNWVKVTQRVPVKIRVLNPDPRLPLRVGTSAVVTVDTTAKPALAHTQ